jgi:hypothetical protein|tara:strand:- start:9301 stop:10146 length:846 start_codon:yes stop_codon:yes gene_type:complete
MKLAKTKLKQIIKQEVIKKLLEQDDEKFKPPGRSRRDFLKGVGAAAAVGTGARTLSKMVDADKEARAADRNKHAEEQYKKAYSFDKKASEFNEYVNNPAAFRWARGEGSMMQLPGSIKKDEHGIPRGITVLPASYSIAVLAYNDKLNGRNKFPPPSSQVSFTKSADGAGASESMKYFFDEFKDSFIDANLAFDVPGIQQLPAQGLERGILMINPNTLMSDPEYVLPENGLTVREYYNWLYYNQFLSIDEVLATDYESIDGERMRSLLDSATPGQWKQALRK